MTDLNYLVKKIIQENQYLSLATCGGGNSWVTPVAYAVDEKFNFYFGSLPDSKHCLNIFENNQICLAIFDSHQNWGEGVGLQIEGKCEQVTALEFPNVFKLYFGRKYPYGDLGKYGQGLKKMLNGKIYRFYKITPKTFWINDPNAETDRRVEVKP